MGNRSTCGLVVSVVVALSLPASFLPLPNCLPLSFFAAEILMDQGCDHGLFIFSLKSSFYVYGVLFAAG